VQTRDSDLYAAVSAGRPNPATSVNATSAVAIPARSAPVRRAGSVLAGAGRGATALVEVWSHEFIPTSNMGPVSFVLTISEIAIDLLIRRMPGEDAHSIGSFA
jgi:hypothetical protein